MVPDRTGSRPAPSRRRVLSRYGKLPPVLPIVIYNGSSPWTAAEDVAEMVAGRGETLAPYQPSQRYYLLDERRIGAHDLPGRNLMSALIALETNRERERTPALVAALIERLRELGDTALTRVFQEWVTQRSRAQRSSAGLTGARIIAALWCGWRRDAFNLVRVVAVPVRVVVRVYQHGGMVPDRAGFVENDGGSRWQAGASAGYAPARHA